MAYSISEIHLAAGSLRAYRAAEWRGALVLVKEGAIELETVRGIRATFSTGSVLFLGGLRLRLLRNRDTATTVLVAIFAGVPRKRPGDAPGAAAAIVLANDRLLADVVDDDGSDRVQLIRSCRSVALPSRK